MKVNILLIILLVFNILNLDAQTPILKKNIITVIDSQTKQSLPYVSVCFESASGKTKKYKVTNINGMVENVSKTDSCIIAVSYIGYKVYMGKISANESKIIELEIDNFNLEQITVTGTRTTKRLKDVPIITQIISSNDINNRGLTSIKDVLADDMPGIDFQQVGYGIDIKMQGLDANYILFLIDGERLAGESGGNIDYSRLNTANIERIEIIKGAASALYGSQAMGGVINIITKKASKKVEVNIGTKIRQYNEVNYIDLQENTSDFTYKKNLDRMNINNNISVGLNFNKINFLTSFVMKSYDAYQLFDTDSVTKNYSNIDTIIYEPLNESPSHIDGFNDYSVNQKIGLNINEKLSGTLNASYYNHNQYDFVRDNTFNNFIDITYGGNAIYKFNKKSELVASFNSDTYEKFVQSEKTSSHIKNYSHQFKTARLLFSTKLKKHSIITGYENIYETLLSDKFTYDTLIQKNTKTNVLFIQDDIDITKKINVVGGIRTDYHSAFGFHASPKLSLMYKIKPFTIRLNYANGFRSPNLKELYMNWNHLGMFTIQGSEDLKPETNNYFSVSTEYTKTKFNGSITAFHNRFKNKIEGQWTNNQTIYQYLNVDNSNISGVELSAKYFLLSNLNLSGGYSYLYDKNTANGVRTSTVSPHSGNMRIEYKLRKGIYKATINISGKYFGAKSFDVVDEITYKNEIVKAIYPVKYSPFSVWKFSINQDLYNSINLIIGVDNLFNYKADIITFNTSTTVGRSIFVSLNVDIDNFFN